MSPAELPEPGLADVDYPRPSEGKPDRPAAAASFDEDSEIQRIQQRLEELRFRIESALPEGYDLQELVKASDEDHESEDVLEITGEVNALENLAGPLAVPGKTPPPAFDTPPAIEPLPRDVTDLPSSVKAKHWKWVVLGIVLVAALVGSIALLLPYL